MSQSSGAPSVKKIGRYVVERRLGAGGMGAVYLARDEKLDRRVAIKLPLAKGLTPTHRTRFEREAKAAAAIRHPNVCPVYEVGEVQGRPFIAMAYIEGRPLSELIDPRRPFEQRRAVEIVNGIANGLAAAHAVGVVHRDVKPHNVVLDERGEPILMDFGLARIVETAQQGPTRDGDLLGTPAYMAPEQVEGVLDEIGFHTDVYALGVVLYEMLAGRLPFLGSRDTIREEILRGEPTPIAQHRPDVDPKLAELCAKAMSLDPRSRFRTANEFAAATKAWLVEDDGWRSAPTLPIPSSGSQAGTPATGETNSGRTKGASKANRTGESTQPMTAAPGSLVVGRRALVVGASAAGVVLLGGVGWLSGLFGARERGAGGGGNGIGNGGSGTGGETGGRTGTEFVDPNVTELFNGRNIDGWTAFVRTSEGVRGRPPRLFWDVQDGLLVCENGENGTLVAPGAFGNFELEAELRLPEGAGIQFLLRRGSDERGANVPVPIVDGLVRGFFRDSRPNASPPEERRGPRSDGEGLRGMPYYLAQFMGTEQALRPPGEWNHVRIRVVRGELVLDVNGTRVAELAFSEFGPALEAAPPRGNIGLMTTERSNGIAIRMLRVRTL